ncbi:uncharacterized protein G2W53_040448 [Senna tora]|uniref:Uncharacterized protein n=1 Tax=Senna tora TaxID=362788 RepID=A0A834VY05_9FABA|nr:uncharacterized protein G2W53_040448 [Senna tora]
MVAAIWVVMGDVNLIADWLAKMAVRRMCPIGWVVAPRPH